MTTFIKSFVSNIRIDNEVTWLPQTFNIFIKKKIFFSIRQMTSRCGVHCMESSIQKSFSSKSSWKVAMDGRTTRHFRGWGPESQLDRNKFTIMSGGQGAGRRELVSPALDTMNHFHSLLRVFTTCTRLLAPYMSSGSQLTPWCIQSPSFTHTRIVLRDVQNMYIS